MFKLPNLPSPRSTAAEMADFMEIVAWENGRTSQREISAYLGRLDDNHNNIGCDDDDDTNLERLDEVMIEVERRGSACRGGYPFRLDDAGTVLHHVADANDHRALLYQYFLLSTRMNMRDDKMHAGIDGTHLLEEISRDALKNYFGWSRARSIVFGTSMPGPFSEKVNGLCRDLREGDCFRDNAGNPDAQQDDKLDTVTWIPFSDELPGQVIAFGQCKTGSTWHDDAGELRPDSFIKKWFERPVHVDPVRVFCVSEAVELTRRGRMSFEAGVLFDRCRLVDICQNIEAELAGRVRTWTNAARDSLKYG